MAAHPMPCITEVRTPLTAAEGKPARSDDADERNGAAPPLHLRSAVEWLALWQGQRAQDGDGLGP